MIINDQQILKATLTAIGALLPPQAKPFLDLAVKTTRKVDPSIDATSAECYWTAITAIGSGLVDNKTGTQMVHSVMLCWPMQMAQMADVMVSAEWFSEFPNGNTDENKKMIEQMKRECLALVH